MCPTFGKVIVPYGNRLIIGRVHFVGLRQRRMRLVERGQLA